MVWNIPKKSKEKERSGSSGSLRKCSFEICVFVCKQSKFRLLLIVVERSGTFLKIACDDTIHVERTRIKISSEFLQNCLPKRVSNLYEVFVRNHENNLVNSKQLHKDM